jgi:hypothetical protein
VVSFARFETGIERGETAMSTHSLLIVRSVGVLSLYSMSKNLDVQQRRTYDGNEGCRREDNWRELF